MITTRHIRSDWSEWVDWPGTVQKTVSTMCGTRTKVHLAGIPGITQQEPIVEVGGKRKWGWCMRCLLNLWPYLLPPALTKEITAPAIFDLHLDAQRTIQAQRLSYLRSQYKRANAEFRPQTADAYRKEIDKHLRLYPEDN